jgi:hypothetical protein
MNKLIEKDDCGNWSLKGVRWSNLMPGALITKDTYEKAYAALCKLMDYEDTELDPEDVERINDFDKSQSGKMLKKLNEEQRKHRWIPVSERLPEDGTYLCTLDGELCGIDEPFTGMCGIENGKWDEEGCVIAWMELPEPYRSEGVEQ